MESLKILFLEDNEFDLELIQRELRRSNILFTFQLATNREEFIEWLASFSPDLILSDHSLPQFDSISALKIVRDNYPHIPFILVTGSVSEEFAVRCIKNGAEDYILKSNLIRLPSLIENAMNKKNLKIENDVIKNLNEELKHTQQIISQKNKDITDSIKYAKQIQNSILPDKRLFSRTFPEAFIIYKPKDIVSGDFYWFAEYKNRFLIAVGDCTGHGVPGALLSMIGYHLLNNIIYLRNIIQPEAVLEELNKGIRDIFKQGKKNNTVNDGMDIVFCSFDNKNSTLEYAGAKRPVYIIRKNELEEIKGSSFSIGGIQNGICNYKSTVVQLQQGDKIYMFTDGYTDQFGGTKNKKIKTQRFQEILLEMNAVKMVSQKKILSDFVDEWKKGYDQTDDILVIGIEVNIPAVNTQPYVAVTDKKENTVNRLSEINFD